MLSTVKWNNVPGYLYRNENHLVYPITCALRRVMGRGNPGLQILTRWDVLM